MLTIAMSILHALCYCVKILVNKYSVDPPKRFMLSPMSIGACRNSRKKEITHNKVGDCSKC